jgi:hypothetical protein
MKIEWGEGGSFPQSAKTISGLTVGVRYHVFGFAWVTAGDPAVKFVVASISPSGLDTTLEEDWELFEYSFVATATSHSLQIWPAVLPTAGQTVWIDDIIVQVEADYETRGTIPRFQGPDGHEGPLWLSIDGVTGYRVEPESGPLYARAAAFDAAILAAQTDITDAEIDLGALDVRTDALEAAASSPDVQYFTSSGNWTKPAGAKRVFVECQAGGASGGGAAATSAGQAAEGAGGGGGGYVAHWFDADDLDTTVGVTVGDGGAAAAAGASGNDGEASIFSGQIEAHGGLAGTGGAAAVGPDRPKAGEGGAGGAVGGGPTPDIIHQGGDGGPGIVVATAVTVRRNVGGSSFMGGEPSSNPTQANIGGVSGSRGSGGSGARNGASQSARAGGAGGDGRVRVTTYF